MTLENFDNEFFFLYTHLFGQSQTPPLHFAKVGSFDTNQTLIKNIIKVEIGAKIPTKL